MNHRHWIARKRGVGVSLATMIKWLTENNKYKVYFGKNYSFRDLKNINEKNYSTTLTKKKILTHVIVIVDEKSFITADLLKLRVIHDPLTGELPELMHSHQIITQKSHNIMCSILPLRMKSCNNTLKHVVSEEVGNADVCQKIFY